MKRQIVLQSSLDPVSYLGGTSSFQQRVLSVSRQQPSTGKKKCARHAVGKADLRNARSHRTRPASARASAVSRTPRRQQREQQAFPPQQSRPPGASTYMARNVMRSSPSKYTKKTCQWSQPARSISYGEPSAIRLDTPSCYRNQNRTKKAARKQKKKSIKTSLTVYQNRRPGTTIQTVYLAHTQHPNPPVENTTKTIAFRYFPKREALSPGLSTRTTLTVKSSVLSMYPGLLSTKSSARVPEKVEGFGPTLSCFRSPSGYPSWQQQRQAPRRRRARPVGLGKRVELGMDS